MPIINGNRFQKKEKIKIELSSETIARVKDYCEWAKIENLDHFLEEAVSFVLTKDTEWKRFKKSSKKSAVEKSKA